MQIDKPTPLQQIRSFLEAQQVAPPPWSPPGSAVDRLVTLLHQRREDDGFWVQLQQLTQSLDESFFDRAALSQIEALSDTTVDRLVDELRAEIRRYKSQPGGVQWHRGKIGVSALAAFLLLGTAVACDSDESCEEEAAELDLDEEETEEYCELVGYVQDADISGKDRQALLDCVPELAGHQRETMLSKFQDASDKELSEFLENIFDDCHMCGDDSDCH